MGTEIVQKLVSYFYKTAVRNTQQFQHCVSVLDIFIINLSKILGKIVIYEGTLTNLAVTKDYVEFLRLGLLEYGIRVNYTMEEKIQINTPPKDDKTRY